VIPLEPQRSCAKAHAAALAAAAAAPNGKLLHLVTTVTDPTREDLAAYSVALDSASRGHSVGTVANTVFPRSLYRDPGLSWAPEMPARDAERLDRAALDLYEAYSFMLPGLIRADPSSARGTYFGCLVSWPGKRAGGYNQLAGRVRQLRAQRVRVSTFNATDLVLEGAGELGNDEEGASGLQVVRSDEARTQSFPCLVHIEVSVLDGQLSMMAVYRHWHLVRKAYGNLLGLAALQGFLARQSGFEVGELVVHGGVANAEFGSPGGAGAVRRLAGTLGSVLESVPAA